MIQEPVPPTLSPAPARAPRSLGVRIGIVVAICVALAVPVVIAMAASSSLSPNPANLGVGATAAPNVAPNATADPDGKGHGFGFGFKGQGGPMGNWFKGQGGSMNPGRGPITIKSIKDSDLGLGTPDGWARTITVTSTTVITKGGQTITLADLDVGDEIGFKQTRNADGTYTITAITVVTPRAGGEVSVVSGNDITVKQRDGSTKVITVTATTVYKLGQAPGTKSDVTVGSYIDAQGTISGTTFTALSVDIRPAFLGGEVTVVSGNDITVKQRDGSTKVITVTATTVYKLGKAPGAKSDVTVGAHVDAQGTISGSTFTALSVDIRPAVVGGEVTVVSGNDITVKQRDGSSKTIHVTGSTTYYVWGKATASLSDIAVGDRVTGSGKLRADGSLDATNVAGGPAWGKKPATAPAAPSAAPG